MEEPDVKAIKKYIGISDEFRFMGFILLSTEKEDFLFSCKTRYGLYRQLNWTPIPDDALRYDKYRKALNLIERFELEEKVIVVMFFASVETAIVCGIPEKDEYSE